MLPALPIGLPLEAQQRKHIPTCLDPPHALRLVESSAKVKIISD